MVFKCAHCEKDIMGMSIVIDKTHIIHKLCEDSYNREKIINKWKEAGFLDGIKGPISDDKANLFECCK